MPNFIKTKITLRDHIISGMIIFFGLVLIGIMFSTIFVPFAEFLKDQIEMQPAVQDYVIR
jgi:uncharacterized membrane protein (DUF485 family)